MNKKLLISGLNQLYYERAYSVDLTTLLVYSKGEIRDVESFLKECSELGLLEIVKSVMEAEGQENCIKLISPIPSALCCNNQ